jgi:hypothetical protein
MYPEEEDFRRISEFYGIKGELVAPRLCKQHFQLQNLLLLTRLIFAALTDPVGMSRIKALNLNLGQMAVDSQRRRTLSVSAQRLPTRYPQTDKYPALRSASPRLLRVFVQSLFRYGFDVWFLAIFWFHWLHKRRVSASFQLHVERAEFQIVTNLLNQMGSPVFLTLEYLSEDYSTRRRRLSNEFKHAKSKRRSNLHPGQGFKNDLVKTGEFASEISWTFGQRYKPLEFEKVTSKTKRVSLMKPAHKAYVIALPATWEAFNHCRDNRYLHNFEDWFGAVQAARLKDSSSAAEVWIKPHPFEYDHVWAYIQKDIMRLAQGTLGQDFTILDREESWQSLQYARGDFVVVSLSSTSIVDAATLGIKVIACELNEYDLWDFARPPQSWAELVERLTNSFQLASPAKSEVESAINFVHVKTWYKPLQWTVLASGLAQYDLNQVLWEGGGAYAASSRGLILTENSLRAAQSEVEHAVSLCAEYSR